MHSAGKTYTLKGKQSSGSHGVIHRAIEELFALIQISKESRKSTEYEVFLSIYQISPEEKLTDLLESGHTLKIEQFENESSDTETTIKGLSSHLLKGAYDFPSKLTHSLKLRKVAEARDGICNLSLKSSFIIQLNIVGSKKGGKKVKHMGVINFVELAGSEQAAPPGRQELAKGVGLEKMRKEISRGFNAVSSCLLQTGLGQPMFLKEDDALIKRCLVGTLGGDNKVLLICNVDPSPDAFKDSLPSLNFCARIRSYIIRNLAKRERKIKERTFHNSPSEYSQVSEEPSFRGDMETPLSEMDFHQMRGDADRNLHNLELRVPSPRKPQHRTLPKRRSSSPGSLSPTRSSRYDDLPDSSRDPTPKMSPRGHSYSPPGATISNSIVDKVDTLKFTILNVCYIYIYI